MLTNHSFEQSCIHLYVLELLCVMCQSSFHHWDIQSMSWLLCDEFYSPSIQQHCLIAVLSLSDEKRENVQDYEQEKRRKGRVHIKLDVMLYVEIDNNM
jgi:hypothetical protein